MNKLLVMLGAGLCFFISSAPARANQLACAAQLCLSGGASCGNVKFPGCGAAIGHYCHLMGLWKGFGKAMNFLNQCRYEGSATVIDFALVCTGDRIFQHLTFFERWNDDQTVQRVRLDVPEQCKRFARETRAATQGALAQLPPGEAITIPVTNLLPVMSVRWKAVTVYEEYGRNSRVTYTPEYRWTYAEAVPPGFSLVYDPNSGRTLSCPPRFSGDSGTRVYSPQTGC
jgi:hypothetical protein